MTVKVLCSHFLQLEPHELTCKEGDGTFAKLKLRTIQGIINLCKKLPDRCVQLCKKLPDTGYVL
jgi:hypothetical protein